MVEYTQSLDGIDANMLSGFFVGWQNPPSAQTHLSILSGSYCVWLAVDGKRVVGFITAVSDGVLSAYIPLLEVLPEYQNLGIGGEQVSRMLDSLKGLYMVDLLCDAELQSYYKRFGMHCSTGSLLRNFDRQSCEL